MKDNESILEKLRANNPFASTYSPLPWDNMIPDLQQLNRNVSGEIEQLIRNKRREPSVPLAGLIIGELGAGKTHMLARILRKLRENENPAIFVIVKTFRDPESITQHLLSEIFISLRHMHSKGRSQFDVLTEEVMNVYNERRRNDEFDDISRIDKRIYLSRDMPRLDKNFLKALLLYIDTKDESVKFDVLEWLENGLDDEDCARLGLPAKDIDSMSDAKRENVAEKTLISLGLILGYAKIPMIVCFDQIDILAQDRKLIEAFGALTSFLANDMTGILLLCFMRPDTWNNFFMPVLDASVVRRLESNKMIMQACTPQQTLQLIHDRVFNAFKENPEEIYQWLMGRMENTFIQDMPPSEIIEQVNRLITNDETGDDDITIYKAVSSAYDEEYKNVQSESNEWPPNADNLTLALDVWLNSHDEFESVKGSGKYIKLQGIYNGRKYAFVILTAKGHSTVSAGLRHGMEFIKEYPDGKCFYITEDKTHKRTWKQANKNLAKFKNMGGHVIMLDKDTRINWYALTALINRTDNGDVNLYLLSGSRTASREDIKSFVCTLNLIPEIFTENSKKTQQKVNAEPESRIIIEPDVLGVNLKSILNSSPMRMITVEKAIEFLSRRRIAITRKELLLF
ncbi:MAG: ATP-binding protein, partial [Synergistaceae bacterium]|nr:ATP-binding protein [Synergistaceae bacterium]